MDRLKSWLKLKSAPGLGFQTIFRLLETFGEPSLWTHETLQSAFSQKFIFTSAFDYLNAKDDPPGWKAICRYMDDFSIGYATLLDSDYPELLKNIYSPPLLLFYRGKPFPTSSGLSLGVVGTRKPSEYGKSMTAQIVEPVAAAGVTIISGLAYGIDTVAHKAALKAGGRTIAVLAHGLDSIYPPQNRTLAEQIMEKGALISEYEPGSKMERWNFPARNRIISGLSQGVLVTEGSLSSGAMLTAKFALEQNRDLYALPGHVNLENAQGPNHLIRNGARLISSAADLLQDLGLDQPASEQLNLFPELTETEQHVWDIFREAQREISFDELVLKTGWSIGQLSIVLLNLELKGVLLKAGGNSFVLR